MPAGVGARVAVADALEVLATAPAAPSSRPSHSANADTSGPSSSSSTTTVAPASPNAAVLEARRDGAAHGRLAVERHRHALAGREAVGLHHRAPAQLVDEGERPAPSSVNAAGARGGDAAGRHHRPSPTPSSPRCARRPRRVRTWRCRARAARRRGRRPAAPRVPPPPGRRPRDVASATMPSTSSAADRHAGGERARSPALPGAAMQALRDERAARRAPTRARARGRRRRRRGRSSDREALFARRPDAHDADGHADQLLHPAHVGLRLLRAAPRRSGRRRSPRASPRAPRRSARRRGTRDWCGGMSSNVWP